MHSTSGFTILELIIAVVIIGLLVTVGIPNYMRQSEQAKCAKAITALQTIRTAQLVYYSDTLTFSNNQGILDTRVGGELFDAGNPEWTFSIDTANSSILQLRATRLRGPHQVAGNTTITLTDDVVNNISQQWAGTYPKDDPGAF